MHDSFVRCNMHCMTDAPTRRRRRSNRYVTMDQREELRSLYCVVCPRCESVSPADDLSCPYCGADRHGAVLTRAQASLLGIDEAARALVRAASSQVGDMRRDQVDDATRADSANQSAALVSSPTYFAVKRKWAAVLTVGVCVLAGIVAWVRTSHSPGAGEPHDDRVSVVGTVHKLPPVAPAARSDDVAPGGSASDAQARFLAMTNAPGRAIFALPASMDIAPCATASMPACDTLAESQASSTAADTGGSTATVVPEAPHSIASASAKPAARKHGRVEHASVSTRQAPTHSRAHANERTTHAQPAPRSVRHAKKIDKTHPRVRTVQRTVAPPRGEADASDAPGAGTVAPVADPAMTSSASWKPGSGSEPNDNLRSRIGRLLPAGVAATNKGRGEAH